jgi:hypothetical protein
MRSTRQRARRTEQEATIDDTEEDTHVFNTMPDGTPPPGNQGWEYGHLAEENDELPQYDNPAEANDVDELPYNGLPENLSASDSDEIAEITEAAFMGATGETLFASAETSAEATLRFGTSAEAATAERTAEAAAENTAGDTIKENIEKLMKQLFELSLLDMRNLMDTQAIIAENRARDRGDFSKPQQRSLYPIPRNSPTRLLFSIWWLPKLNNNFRRARRNVKKKLMRVLREHHYTQ